MHVGPLRTSVKTELYGQSHWVGAGQTEILSPNTTQTPQDHWSDYVRRFTKSWGSMHNMCTLTHTAFCAWDALELQGTLAKPQLKVPGRNTQSANSLMRTEFYDLWTSWKNMKKLSNRGRTKAKQRKTQPMRHNFLNLNWILKTNDYLKEIAAWTILGRANYLKKIWTIFDWSLLASF